MLADSCEAAVRAARPTSVEEIDKVVRRIVNDKLTSGDLDECDLTTRDLNQIRDAFTEMLHGVFHPRVKYPSPQKNEELASSSPAALPAPQSVPATSSAPAGKK